MQGRGERLHLGHQVLLLLLLLLLLILLLYRCSSFPRESCALDKVRVTKLSPETGCDKRPVELCAPRGCALVNVSYILSKKNLEQDEDRTSAL